MQQLNLDGFTKEQRAIEFIQKHEPREGYFLGFSGGKDSVVLKHLADMAMVEYDAYYSATGIDPPEVVKFIREYYPGVIFKRPLMKMPRKYPDWEGTRSFFGMIPRRGYPTKFSKWCCDVLKKDPTKDVPLNHRLMGIRAEESNKRSLRPKIDKYKKWTIYKPIFSWLEWEIWDFIERHDLHYCSLYDEGFSRIGCVVCPVLTGGNGAKLKQAKERWPEHYVAFEKSMKRLWNNVEWHKRNEKKLPQTFDEFLDNWYSAN